MGYGTRPARRHPIDPWRSARAEGCRRSFGLRIPDLSQAVYTIRPFRIKPILLNGERYCQWRFAGLATSGATRGAPGSEARTNREARPRKRFFDVREFRSRLPWSRSDRADDSVSRGLPLHLAVKGARMTDQTQRIADLVEIHALCARYMLYTSQFV